MQNAIIYCRVSTQEQAEHGYSLDAQEKLCSKYAQDNGFRIVGVFRDEGKTGTSLNRPALKDALFKCQQDKSIKALIIQETDRLARNTKDHLTIKGLLNKSDIKIISVAQPMLDDSPEGMMIDTILASINQFQSDINSRKSRKGLQEKFEQGLWPGLAPLGYVNVTIEGDGRKTKKIIKKDPQRWALLRQGFRLYLSGNYSVEAINDILYENGLRSRRGKRIPHSVMSDALKNSFYAGIMKWRGLEGKGKHKPMITINEHRHILEIMDSHNLRACRRRKHSFLLRGFVFCNICGRRYTAEKHPKKKKEYYRCASPRKEHSNFGQYVEASDLEAQIKNQFKRFQFNKDIVNGTLKKLKEIYYRQRNDIKVQKQILYNQKKALEAKRDKAEEKLLNGVLSDKDFIRLRDKFKSDLYSIQNSIIELDNQREYDISAIQEVIKLTRNIFHTYKTAPYELQRQYLGLFWDKFLVQNKKIVKAVPSKLFSAFCKDQKVRIRGKMSPSSTVIRTLLNDVEYISVLNEKLNLIKELQRTL